MQYKSIAEQGKLLAIRNRKYDTDETNHPVCTYSIQANAGYQQEVFWKEPGLKVKVLWVEDDALNSVIRVRFCSGILSGNAVRVILPFSTLPRKDTKKAIVAAAKASGVHAKRLGILDAIEYMT